MTVLPKEIRENIARAKGYLRRNEVMRAMEAMASNLRLYTGTPSLKQHSFNISILVQDFIQDLRFHPRMKCLLDPRNTGTPSKLAYKSNKEIALAVVLEGLAKLLQQVIDAENDQSKDISKNRLQSLIATGEAYFQEGDITRGRAYFGRAASEFGKNEGVYIDLARRLVKLEQYRNAAALYELAIEKNPKNSTLYVEGIDSYLKVVEYEKAEGIFLKILKQFGGHAKTYGRMAKLYLDWNKKAKADDYANRALQLDKEQVEALEVRSKVIR